MPKSLPWASAHSRIQPLTPPLSLWGARIPRYLSSIPMAKDTLSCRPKRHQVLPTQLFTVLQGAFHKRARFQSPPRSIPPRYPGRSPTCAPPNRSMRWPPTRDLRIEMIFLRHLAQHDQLVRCDLPSGDPGHHRNSCLLSGYWRDNGRCCPGSLPAAIPVRSTGWPGYWQRRVCRPHIHPHLP